MDFGGKIALVTGAARGVGESTAKAFLMKGARGVLLCDILEEVGQTATAELQKAFGATRAEFFTLDVRSSDNIRLAFERCQRAFGSYPDIVVNNAGILGEQKWEVVIDTNLKVGKIVITSCK